MTKTMKMSALGAMAALAAACGSGQHSAPSLKNTKVPAGFTFQTSRSVAVSLTAAPSLGGAGKGIKIARPDGKVLYQGMLRAGAPLQAKLAVPSRHEQLVATVDGRAPVTLDIRDGRAAATLQ
jgi:hypothetical protein